MILASRSLRWSVRTSAALLFGAAMSFAASACSSGDDGAATALDEAEVVPPGALHVLGTSESLARVQDVKAGAGDTVWVLNSADPFLIAFVVGGGPEPARAWGKRGGGPREFVSPSTLGRGPDGRVWVYDQGRHGLILASGSDEDWTEIALPTDSLPRDRLIGSEQIGMIRPWIASRGRAFVFAVTSASEPAAPRFWKTNLVAVDPADPKPRVVFSTVERLGDPATRWSPLAILMPHPLWDICVDDKIVAYDPLRNEIRRFHDGGDDGKPIPLPAERSVEVTPDRVFDIAYRDAIARFPSDNRPDSAEIRRQFDEQIQAMGAMFGSTFPEYADLRCAANGELWIQRFDIGTGPFGKGPVWLRIAPNGSTRAIRLPDGFTAHEFTRDRVWGVLRDALDVASIAWIDL